MTRAGRYLDCFTERSLSSLGPTILDAGCSRGLTTIDLAVWNPAATVIGMDRNAARIEDAAQTLKSSSTDSDLRHRVTFRLGDFYDVQSPVDAFVCVNNLSLASDFMSSKALLDICDSIYRSIHDRGKLLLGDLGYGIVLEKSHSDRCFRRVEYGMNALTEEFVEKIQLPGAFDRVI